MPRKTLIKIKKEPKPPVRKEEFEFKYSIGYGTSLAEIVDWAQESAIPLGEFALGNDGYYDSYEGWCEDLYFSYIGSEPEEEYQCRLASYEKSKVKFDRENKFNRINETDQK